MMKLLNDDRIKLLLGIVIVAVIIISNMPNQVESGEPYGIEISEEAEDSYLSVRESLLYYSIPPDWRKRNGIPAQYTIHIEEDSRQDYLNCEYGDFEVIYERVDVVVTLSDNETDEVFREIFPGVELDSCPDDNEINSSQLNEIEQSQITLPTPVEEWLLKLLADDPILADLEEDDLERRGMAIELEFRVPARFTDNNIPFDRIAGLEERPRYLLSITQPSTTIEVCDYSYVFTTNSGLSVQSGVSSRTVERILDSLNIEIVDLLSGETIATHQLFGELPEDCPETLDSSLNSRIVGGLPEESEFTDWFMAETEDYEALIFDLDNPPSDDE